MSRKTNPAVIGGFVVGAIVLAVAGVLIFGSSQMFKDTSKYVCFFPGAVDGLNIGAPVKFKGVEIGSVVDIRLRLSEQPQGEVLRQTLVQGLRIPVTIEMDNVRLQSLGGRGQRDIRLLVDQGLRAQLATQSMVTGLLFVQLRFYPDTEAVFVLPRDSKTEEIPTLSTTMEQMQTAAEQLFRRLDDVHVESLVTSVTEAVDTAKAIVATPELKEAIQGLPATEANVNQAVTDIAQAARSLREITTRLESNTGPLIQSLTATSDKTAAAAVQAEETLQSVKTMVAPDSAFAAQLNGSLQEVSDAARSLRLLADYLERNPSALVRGKDVTP